MPTVGTIRSIFHKTNLTEVHVGLTFQAMETIYRIPHPGLDMEPSATEYVVSTRHKPSILDTFTTGSGNERPAMEKYFGEYGLGPEIGSIIVNQYLGDMDEHGCYSGHGEATFRSGNTYVGEFRNGVMDGKGLYTWTSDGTVYEGDFSKNELVGNGRYTWGNGSLYEGAVSHGLRNGEGTYTSADGTLVYEGFWKDGKRDGYGVQRYGVGTSSVSSFSGEWQENLRHGRGIMTYASRNKYDGYWVKDHKEGEGVMTWVKQRERYTGEWKADQQCGYGVHIWEEDRPEYSVAIDTQKQMCNLYKGHWLDGMRHGQGKFLYADGSKYVGYWLRNKKHGPAVFITDKGRTFEGVFEDDFLADRMCQDLEHPELSPAVRLHISDITPCGQEAGTSAIIREVERSALQINSDLKLVYKRYTRAGTTGPRDSTMFTMSLQQFVAFARDCRALKPFTPITIGEVYRIFFRMRRQHAWEVACGLKRAMEQTSTNGHDTSAARIGRQHEDGQTAWLSEMDVEDEIYDSRRAITFREFVEGVVRLATAVGTISIDGGTRPISKASKGLPSVITASSAADNSPASGVTHAARSTTLWSPAVSCLGTAAPQESYGAMTTIFRDDGGCLLGAMGGNMARELSLNDHFKRFATDHLRGLMHVLKENAVSGWRRGQGNDSTCGDRGVRGGAGNVNKRRDPPGCGKHGEVKIETEDVVSQAVEKLEGAETQVKHLYSIYSGPMNMPMTLRGLLRMSRDAALKQRAGLTPADINQATSSLESHGRVKSQSMLRQPEAPLDNETVGASVGTQYSDRLGEPADPAATTSATVLDLDTLDQELMSDGFKIVLAKLFEMLRVKVSSAYPGGLLEPDTSKLIANEADNTGTSSGDISQIQQCNDRWGNGSSKEDEEPSHETRNGSADGDNNNESKKTTTDVSPPEGHVPRGGANPRNFVLQILKWAEDGRIKHAGRIALQPTTVPRKSLLQSKHLGVY